MKENTPAPLNICAKCGRSLRGASLTNWLFGACSCDKEASAQDEQSFPHPADSIQTLTASQRGLIPGDRLDDRYDIETFVGEGGMGQVFQASCRGLKVAVKVLRDDLVGNKAAVERFLTEAQAAQTVKHENLVSLLDNGTTEYGAPYYVMEFVEGQSLAALISKTTRLDPEQAVEIFVQVAEGMAHAHLHGVIHRDLKPNNVILATDSKGQFVAKIVDFGIAKLLNSARFDQNSMTMTGELIGSPSYMSPEQCLGAPVGAGSDIYSLGCVMYEALTGKPPFPGDNAINVILQHLNDQPKPIRPDLHVPPGLEAIVFHALEKRPTDRYRSMSELCSDLQAVRAGKKPLASKGHLGPWGGAAGRKRRLTALVTTALVVFSALAGALVSTFLNSQEFKAMFAQYHAGYVARGSGEPNRRASTNQTGVATDSAAAVKSGSLEPRAVDKDIASIGTITGEPQGARGLDYPEEDVLFPSIETKTSPENFFPERQRKRTAVMPVPHPARGATDEVVLPGGGMHNTTKPDSRTKPDSKMQKALSGQDLLGYTGLPVLIAQAQNHAIEPQALDFDRQLRHAFARVNTMTVHILETKRNLAIPGPPYTVFVRNSNAGKQIVALTQYNADSENVVAFVQDPDTASSLISMIPVKRLVVAGPGLTPVLLDSISKQPTIIVLNLRWAEPVDADLKSIASMRLRTLVLAGPGITDVGVGQIAKMRSLVTLYLVSTYITDASIASLQALPRLTRLDVTSCDLSDQGLEKLLQFPRLNMISIGGTKASAALREKLLRRFVVDYRVP